MRCQRLVLLRLVLLMLALGAGLAALALGKHLHRDTGKSAAAQIEVRPNVVLVAVDTTRPDHLGCYVRFPAPAPDGDCIRVTDQALRLLAKQSDEPFFLFLHYYDPHDPYRSARTVPHPVWRHPDGPARQPDRSPQAPPGGGVEAR